MKRSANAFWVGLPTSAMLIWTPAASSRATSPRAAYWTPWSE
jgi:hypothetical protein